jgi:hypothetical protein
MQGLAINTPARTANAGICHFKGLFMVSRPVDDLVSVPVALNMDEISAHARSRDK